MKKYFIFSYGEDGCFPADHHKGNADTLQEAYTFRPRPLHDTNRIAAYELRDGVLTRVAELVKIWEPEVPSVDEGATAIAKWAWYVYETETFEVVDECQYEIVNGRWSEIGKTETCVS